MESARPAIASSAPPVNDNSPDLVGALEDGEDPSGRVYFPTILTCENTATEGFRSPLRMEVPLPFSVPRMGSRPQGRRPLRMLALFPGLTASWLHDDESGACRLTWMVDRIDPDHSPACRGPAVAAPRRGRFDSGEAQAPEPQSLLADEPMRDFSFIGSFNGAPDLFERSEEILREGFAKRADADH